MTAIKKLLPSEWIKYDKVEFKKREREIRQALDGSTGMLQLADDKREDVFYMLMFCLCVPQSKAIRAEEAIQDLRHLDFYKKNIGLRKIISVLKGRVRFHNQKARRLQKATFIFDSIWQLVQDINQGRNAKIRDYLAMMVSGMGLKLSSHFLRNIGVRDLAIIDVHVLDGLKKRRLIDRGKVNLTKSRYFDIENTMKGYASQCDMTLQELDLYFWSEKTGYVFK